MKVLELFGGIGACTQALKRIGVDVEVADYVEIDKYACASYNAINGTSFEPQDICEWDKNIEADVIMHGSPCQDFSVAGKQAGGDVGSGTRSSLMYETVRIVGKLRPKYVVWENVKNLLSAKHRHNFDAYLETMKALGYTNYYQVLNAKDYGIPQNRERVFTISIRKDVDKGYKFPSKQELKIRLKDILENEVEEKYYINKLWHFSTEQDEKHDSNEIAQVDGINYKATRSITDINKICRTLDTMGGGQREPKIIDTNFSRHREYNEYSCAIDTYANKLKVENNYRIRKLTPKECWRLMGFDDESFEKAAKVNSNTQLYKQAGNSIVVNVLEAIFKNLF